MDRLRDTLRVLPHADAKSASMCLALIHASLRDAALCIEAARDGACMEALLDAVAAHPADVAVQGCAWALARALLDSAPESHTGAAAAACRLGALPACISALHLAHATLHQEVLGLLCLFSERNHSVATQLSELGAVEAVVASLRTHNTPGTATAALGALNKLLHPLNCSRALQAGVVQAVTAAMRTHDASADAKLVTAGYNVLETLMQHGNDDFYPLAAASHVVELAIHDLRKFMAVESVRAKICIVLGRLACNSDLARTIAEKGAASAILVAFRSRPVSLHVLFSGCSVFHNCYIYAPDHRNMLMAADAVEAIVSALAALASMVVEPEIYSQTLCGGYIALHALTAADAEATQRALKAGALRLPSSDEPEGARHRFKLFERLNAAVAAANAKADAFMAELLAEEAASKAGSASSKKRKSKSKTKSSGSANAAAEDAPPVAAPVASLVACSAEGAAASSASDAEQPAALPESAPPALPSAAEVRRRRRAGTKATRRSGAPASPADVQSDDDGAPASAGSCAAVTAEEEAQPPPPSEQPLASVFPWLSNATPSSTQPLPPQLPPLPRAPWDAPAPAAPSAHDARMAELEAQLAAMNAALAAQAAAQAETLAAKDAALAALKAEADAAPKCSICLDATPCVVLLPCRHLPLCGAPACAAMLGAPPLCPICRKPVADTLSAFV